MAVNVSMMLVLGPVGPTYNQPHVRKSTELQAIRGTSIMDGEWRLSTLTNGHGLRQITTNILFHILHVCHECHHYPLIICYNYN